MNTYKYTLPAVAALLVLGLSFSSCSKVQEEEVADKPVKVTTDVGESIVTFQLNVPVSEDTKTALGTKSGSSYPVKWSSGDQNRISLNGSAPTASTKDSDTQITATFKPASGLSVYNFLYRGDDGHDNQVTIPAAQAYYANDFDDAAMPMYAASATRPSANNGRVTFSHLCALLRFSITGSKKIDSITLTPVDGSKSLSGTFTIGKNGAGLLNGTLTPATGGGAVNLNFGSHIQLSNTPFVFYVAIPAGTYAGGLDVHIVDNDQGHMDFKVLKDNNSITAGKVRELDTFAYEQVKDPTLKQISNATTFQEFVTAVANGEKNLNARLTPKDASIDLSGISFNSIDDYQGTFDGGGKTLTGLTKPMFNNLKGVVKNLTLNSTISITDKDDYNLGIFARQVIPSSEIDDIAGLQNCTAKGSITYTPSSALSANPSIGGMVGNNKGGAFINCTNEATVTLADNAGVTHTGDRQPSVGGVVGRSQKGGDLNTQGNISSCTNSGTVSCAEQFEGNIMIGGVIGYGVESGENISGCTNSGLVKAASTCSTTKVIHIGGIAGMYKGATIESCSNLTAGIVTTESGSAAGTYLCQGGVIGRMNHPSAEYSGLSNAGTLNVAAVGGSKGRLVGGVVGRCNEGCTISDFTNSGNINYTAEATNDTYIGGVVASNTTSGLSLENCYSTGGTMTVSNASHSGALYVGGVVGYSTKAVTSCSNAMTIATSGSMTQGTNSYLCFGGVIGYMSGAVLATSCTNSGAINFGQSQSSEGQLYIGGIAGAVTGAEIYGGSNSGTITFTGQNTKRPPSVGGIVGRVFSNTTDSGYSLNNNVTNSGSIVFNSSVSSSQYMYAGGLVGQHLGGNIYGTNNAPITVTELHEAMMALGGIVGYLAGGTVSNGTNTANGDIAVNGFISGYHSYVGGIVGMSSGGSSIAAGGGTITGASNAGDVTVAAGCTIPMNNFVGGVIAYAGNTVSGASNSGNIENNYSQSSSSNGTSYHFQIGGVAGRSAAALSNCYNTGNVTNNGTTYKSEINVAGVVAYTDASLTSCSNGTSILAGGTISNTAKSGTNTIKDLQVAGIVANNRGQSLTSCFNKGAINNSGQGAQISVGGITAWSNDGSSYSDCYNEGDITNSANSGNTTTGILTVAGISGYAKTTTFSKCINHGDVTNTGVAGKDDTYCRVGGLVGQAIGVDMSASGANKNINYGDVSEASDSKDSAFAGVVAYAEGDVSDFSNCRNEGKIILGGKKRYYMFFGGIAGAFANASKIDNTFNTGLITANGATLASTGYLRLGGIIGGWFKVACTEQTITGCTNSGEITITSDNLGLYSSGAKVDCFVGGIAGGGKNNDGECGKALVNCKNSGNITLKGGDANGGKLYHMFCIGGIIGYSDVNPTGSKCIADISFNSTKGYNRVGGIAGEMMISEIHDVTYKGNVNTNGTSGTNNYVGLLVGNVGTGEKTFNKCTVSGTSRGANGTSNCAGIFFSCDGGGTGPTINIASCKVGSGTRLQTGGSTFLITITDASEITAGNVCGQNGTNRTCTTGTNDNNSTVVDPDTITL